MCLEGERGKEEMECVLCIGELGISDSLIDLFISQFRQ